MPNAPTHDLITLATAAAADIAYYRMAPHPDTTLAVVFTATYLFAGYACAGDLDLNSREYRRWGALRFLSWPYRKCVPHRSSVSHGLVMGGVLRVLYLSIATTLVFWLGLWAYNWLGPHINATAVTETGWQTLLGWVRVHPLQTEAALASFILAGSMHSLADFIYSGIKRRTRVFR